MIIVILCLSSQPVLNTFRCLYTATMLNNIPHFKYHKANSPSYHSLCIEVDGKVIHEIDNLDEFYKTFGYTQAERHAGVLPEEFIWEKYVKENGENYFACKQMHLIDYLKRCSWVFRNTYGNLCEHWVAFYANSMHTKSDKCAACKHNLTCSYLK